MPLLIIAATITVAAWWWRTRADRHPDLRSIRQHQHLLASLGSTITDDGRS